jgi:hypothetical protein
MRWLLLLIAAIILLPVAFSLLKLATGLALTVLQFAVVAAIVIFLVGLVRRLLLLR